MNKLAFVFWSAVGGVGVCLIMTIYTSVTQHRMATAAANHPIAIPITR